MRREQAPVPKAAEWIVRLTTPARDRAVILGDLEEEARQIQIDRGVASARSWYWRQSWGAIVPGLRRSLRRGASREPRPRRRQTLESLAADVRYAARSLRKSPSFSVTAVLVLGLGLGANISIFSLTNAVFLRPVAGATDPSELFRLVSVQPNGVRSSLTYPDFSDLRERVRDQAALAGYLGIPIHFGAAEDSARVRGALVSWDYFDVLGVRAIRGRLFRAEEDRVPEAVPVAIVSHSFWSGNLGGSEDVVGSTVELNGSPFVVVGVLTEGFHGVDRFERQDIFAPMMMQESLRPRSVPLLERRDALWMHALGRTAEGVGIEAVRAALQSASRALEEEHPATNRDRLIGAYAGLGLEPGDSSQAKPLAALLSGFVGLLLLVACANVANLCLARSSERRGEVAIRRALGAPRARVVRQFLCESLLLSGVGAAVGLGIAFATRRLLTRLLPNADALDLSLDARVVWFAAASAVLTALLFGTAPAWRASGGNVSPGLQATGRVAARSRLRSLLVTAQVAFAALLLVMSGLFLETLRRSSQVDPGFDTQRLLVASFDLSLHSYAEDEALTFTRQLLERARAIPGVVNAGLAASVPLSGGSDSWSMRIEGVEPPPNRSGTSVAVNWASAGYFETMSIPLRRGRTFEAVDENPSALTAIVNETFVERYWPDRSPLGRILSVGPLESPTNFEVVGVVADLTYYNLTDRARPFVYLPKAQTPLGATVLHVRTAGEPFAMLPSVRSLVAGLDPSLPLYDASAIDSVVEGSLWQQRLLASLLSLFAALALALGATGVYGVVAFAVAQSTREVGIRMALGADAGRVQRLFLARSATLLCIGLVVGVGAALGLAQLVGGMLYDVAPTDPLVIGGASALLGACVLLAAALPARRATSVDPVSALRAD